MKKLEDSKRSQTLNRTSVVIVLRKPFAKFIDFIYLFVYCLFVLYVLSKIDLTVYF